MPRSKATGAEQPDTAPAATAVRRFRRFGRADELGVVIASGWIDVEELADGTFRVAEGDLPLFEPSESEAAEDVPDAPAAVSDDPQQGASPDTTSEASPDTDASLAAPGDALPAQE